MFRCSLCNTVSEPRVRPARVVTHIRLTTYPFRRGANLSLSKRQEAKEKYRDTDENKKKSADDPGGQGWEIVREVDACTRCAGNVTVETVKTEIAEAV